MKIAFVHFWTLRLRRGVETLVLSLANELAGQGHDVSILTARQTQSPMVEPSAQVHLKQFPTFRYYEFATIAPRYARDLVRSRYDAVIVFFADFGEATALRLAAPWTKHRLVLYLTFPVEAAPHRYEAYRRAGWGKRATRILADARYTAQRGEKFFHRPVDVLPSGTDPERFKPDEARRASTRRELGLSDDEVVLLNVAALEGRKGAWRMIETLPNVRAQTPNVRYLILGEGSQRKALERRVEELNLKESVIFAGTTSDLPRYYNAADIFVMLPDAEAGSVACLEAMASGLPVVVSNTGGFGEVVDESCGRMVDVHDTDMIVSTIATLARVRMQQRQMGEAGRRIVIEKFAWARIAERFAGLLE